MVHTRCRQCTSKKYNRSNYLGVLFMSIYNQRLTEAKKTILAEIVSEILFELVIFN